MNSSTSPGVPGDRGAADRQGEPRAPSAVSPDGSPGHARLARSFDAVAGRYAAARPGYPAALFDALAELTGRPLRGAAVLDVGAGTGIATRLLRDRGARVTAAEPGAGMAAELRASAPAVPLVRADGNALPFADASFDLVTYAQSWHWTDPAHSVPEALRVLRPGGALALWWNLPDPDVPWAAEQEARLARALPGYHTGSLSGEAPEVLRRLGHAPLTRTLHWERPLTLEEHLAHLGSRSYFAAIGPDRALPVLEAERAELLALFPDGRLAEPYAVELVVAVSGKPREEPGDTARGEP
ncbi:class I SAM-dependent methyltransferase [Streptomyces sp. JJ36]|uniref:class I SAM-dependent methyltransferase n=1 Tax=Streptomyces sp. JJ36 TaxID=2736645 RepID=UPI001F393295|nr:class I SAM-dependent methyltransferase [Streptomyces sp. JJ36]MCF6523705.1 methyltransferase domain-containing protein [Streptomyces sp. JJ36]